MKKITLILLLCLSTFFVFAAEDELLDENACMETKEGIGHFLGVADYAFKELEKLDENTPDVEEKKKELFELAQNFSELAENYSTVYSVWCRN